LFLDDKISELMPLIQAHEVLEQHKAATKVVERPEDKKYECKICSHVEDA
jgi:hypothetical protein